MNSHDHRLDEVFRYIVESYVETAEPVGSRAISRMYPEHLSPASIRNVMVDLEEMGLIHQPHTSAGRVPTDKGYRYYVDILLPRTEPEAIAIPDVSRYFEADDIEDGAERLSRLLADLAGNASILYVRRVKRISFVDRLREEIQELLDRISENSRLYVDGTSRVVEQPEFRSAERIQGLLRALETKRELAEILERDLKAGGIHVHIGGEVHCGGLSGVSMVVKEYSVDEEPIGCLAVIGPTRMRYERTIGVVRKLADSITEFLSRE